MAYHQFRQVGAQNIRQTRSELERKLKICLKRIDRILARQTLPPVGQLLGTSTFLFDAFESSYRQLRLHRLAQLRDQSNLLYRTVEDGLFYNRHMNGDVTAAFKTIRCKIQEIISDISEKPKEPEPATMDPSIVKFLSSVADRGWKINSGMIREREAQKVEADAFDQSCKCIEVMAAEPSQLLDQDQDFGIVTAPILLLPNPQIPEQVLNEWAEKTDVYVVFGHYVLVGKCRFMGAVPELVKTQNEIRYDRFGSLVAHANLEGQKTGEPLPFYRRFHRHYYCPVVSTKPQHYRYFSQWDIPLQAKQTKQER